MPEIPLTPFFKGGICKRMLGFFSVCLACRRQNKTDCVRKRKPLPKGAVFFVWC
jgi:hypothetical protein